MKIENLEEVRNIATEIGELDMKIKHLNSKYNLIVCDEYNRYIQFSLKDDSIQLLIEKYLKDKEKLIENLKILGAEL